MEKRLAESIGVLIFCNKSERLASTKRKKKRMHLVEAKRSKVDLNNLRFVETKCLVISKVVGRLSKTTTFLMLRLDFYIGVCWKSTTVALFNFWAQNCGSVVKNEALPKRTQERAMNSRGRAMCIFHCFLQWFRNILRNYQKMNICKTPLLKWKRIKTIANSSKSVGPQKGRQKHRIRTPSSCRGQTLENDKTKHLASTEWHGRAPGVPTIIFL